MQIKIIIVSIYNQNKFRALDIVLADSTLVICLNYSDELRLSNISSSEMNKLETKFVKKCSNLCTANKTNAHNNNWSSISGI